jgi:2,3-bisphosphoglycerate-independent phosphoglycerate mutase
MEEFGGFRLLLLPDHPTPLAVMTHTSEPVPFVIYDPDAWQQNREKIYCEEDAAGGVFIEQGYQLMDLFIKGK